MNEQKKTYKVETPLRFNGSVYHPDKEDLNTIELTVKEAKPLLAIGAVSEISAEGDDKTTSAKEAPTAPAERIAAIKDAIGKLEPGNESHWLNDGKTPEVKALVDLLGWSIKAEERNQAMLDLQADKE